MKYFVIVIVVWMCLVAGGSSSGPVMIAQECGFDSMTIRSLGPPSMHSNPMPGKEIIKIDYATSLLIDGQAYSVSAIIGSRYYVLLQYAVIDVFMYGINLDDGTLFIDSYSPSQNEMYVFGLTYDTKSNYLIGLSNLPYTTTSYFDVVELDQDTGAISRNFSFGEFPEGTVYSGIYAFNQDQSELYVVFKEYFNATESTQEGMVTINTLTGTLTNTVWFTGFQANDTYLYSLVYDSQSQQLIGSTSNYVGVNYAFISINPSSGVITKISNTGTIPGGSGPAIIPGGIFVSPGHIDVSSNTLYYVNITNGELLTKHTSLTVVLDFLSIYNP